MRNEENTMKREHDEEKGSFTRTPGRVRFPSVLARGPLDDAGHAISRDLV
jgi:hypothetical protein